LGGKKKWRRQKISERKREGGGGKKNLALPILASQNTRRGGKIKGAIIEGEKKIGGKTFFLSPLKSSVGEGETGS